MYTEKVCMYHRLCSTDAEICNQCFFPFTILEQNISSIRTA